MEKNSHKSKYQQSKNAIKPNVLIISKKKNSLNIFLIIAFCLPVLLYLQTIKFGFSYFDDDNIITHNLSFLSNFGNAYKAFLTNAFITRSSQLYRPFQTLSYMIDIQLSGANKTWMFHMANILLLGAISCSLFLLLKRFLIPSKLALLSVLIYCVHPLFVSSIAWVPAFGDLLLTFFSILSFIFFIDFLQKKKNIYLFLHLVSFTIALFSKETAALLPFIFIMYYYAFSKEKRFNKRYIFMIMLYAVPGILWYWLRCKAIGGISNPNNVSVTEAIMANIPTIPESLAKFFFPYDNNPLPVLSVFKIIIGLVIMSLIIILLFKNKERPVKEKIFCLTWFLVLMLPPLLIKNIFIDYLDHRFFLPLIGILLFLLFVFPKKWLRNGDIKISWLLVVFFLFFSIFTFIKSDIYSSPVTFYDTAISHNPNCALAYFNRGNIKSNMGDKPRAIEDYNNAIANDSNLLEAYINRGIIKSMKGDNVGAIKDYNKAIAINPNCAEAYNNIGNTNYSQSNNIGAVDNYNKAIAINPNYSEAYTNRAIVKYNLKDFTGTIEDCEKVLKLNPNNQNAIDLKTKAQQELQK